MEKKLLFLTAMLLYISVGYSQATFNTGAIGVDVNEYGKIELSNAAGIYQLWRTSILVGTSSTAVFDYQNDAESLEATALVSNPMQSDYEIYGSFDNSYSGDPPDVIVKLNAYGWTNGNYIVFKFNVKNNGSAAYNASIGLDIIPFIDEVDGYDTVTYNSTEKVIRMHRGNQTNIGMKLLSANLSSLYSFEYYDGYYVDSDYWTWMNFGSVQPQYVSNTESGSVTISAQAPVSLDPGESYNVYYAMALGANQAAMLANIAAAEAKYTGMVVSVEENELAPDGFTLNENYPNPFNQTTSISYRIKDAGFVSLKVYDALGNEVATLVNSEQAGGLHKIGFNAAGLAEGVYYYTLTSDNLVKTNKMVVTR